MAVIQCDRSFDRNSTSLQLSYRSISKIEGIFSMKRKIFSIFCQKNSSMCQLALPSLNKKSKFREEKSDDVLKSEVKNLRSEKLFPPTLKQCANSGQVLLKWVLGYLILRFVSKLKL